MQLVKAIPSDNFLIDFVKNDKLYNFFSCMATNHLTPHNKHNHFKENNNTNNAELLSKMQEVFQKMGEVATFNRVAGKVLLFFM